MRWNGKQDTGWRLQVTTQACPSLHPTPVPCNPDCVPAPFHDESTLWMLPSVCHGDYAPTKASQMVRLTGRVTLWAGMFAVQNTKKDLNSDPSHPHAHEKPGMCVPDTPALWGIETGEVLGFINQQVLEGAGLDRREPHPVSRECGE